MEQQIGFCTTDDGVRIAFGTYGGDGPPLFVLPDIVGQEAIWKHPNGRALLEELGSGRRLITYDARFTGASERRGDVTSLECYARDVAAVVDHFGLERVSLFSLGGISSPMILLYASAHLERVSAIALWGALIAKPRVADDIIETFSRMWTWNTRALSTVYFPSGPLEMQQWFSKAIAQAQFRETFAQIMSQDWDLSPLLPEITTPALILQRERVKSADPRQAREAARLLPNARLVLLDGDADHPIHDYQQHMSTLDAFLEEHAPRRADVRRGAAAGSDVDGAAKLTARELEVLSLLAGGRTGREIAADLSVSLSTAQRHIANIYAKIGARGRVDAAAYALERGLARPRDL